MEILITAAQFILALSILITLHEFGHYWAARAFGIRIEKFILFLEENKKFIRDKKIFDRKSSDNQLSIFE